MACQHYLIYKIRRLTRFFSVALQAGKFVAPTVLWLLWIITFRTCFHCFRIASVDELICRTVSRKNFTTVGSFISEPESRAQCVALEENIKDFKLSYFGMNDRRQGKGGMQLV